MPIFQYKCNKCSSVFEHLTASRDDKDVSCVSCGSKKNTRQYSSNFGIHLKNGECGDGCNRGRFGSFAEGCRGCPMKKFST